MTLPLYAQRRSHIFIVTYLIRRMSFNRVLILFLSALFSGCSTVIDDSHKPDPVMIVYHVKPGAGKRLEPLLARTWETYKSERMVRAKPHVCFKTTEDAEHKMYVEFFEWVGPFATEYPPASVKSLWKEMGELCEARAGHLAVQFRDAEPVQ